jgi:hypothetical protein
MTEHRVHGVLGDPEPLRAQVEMQAMRAQAPAGLRRHWRTTHRSASTCEILYRSTDVAKQDGVDVAPQQPESSCRVRHRCYTCDGRSRPMPTSKRRINITVDDETYAALERLSSRRRQSVAGVGLSLIEEALEYQEDLHYSRIADERLSRNEKRVSHDKAWE